MRSAVVVALTTVVVGLTPVPASAITVQLQLNVFTPTLNAKGNPVFKAQIKVGGCTGATECRANELRVWACAAVWDGTGYFTLGSCVQNSKTFAQQDPNNPRVTATKTLSGGCAHNARYATQGKGQAPYGTVYFLLPGGSGWAYQPPSGGTILC